jgi:CHAT domain-containing protein/tetratricopeptide (TPR) repeat protein
MVSESEVLATLQAHAHRGAYGEAAKYVETLPPEIKSRPLIARERSRTFLRQGHPINAEAALAAANLALATPGQRLILTVEAASLRVFRYVAIREALEAAKAAFTEASPDLIDPTERAKAELVHIRIILTAATYHEVSLEEGRKGRDRLPALADLLEQAGHIGEAFGARFTYAERLENITSRSEALSELAESAIAAGRFDLAGEAHVARAERILADGGPADEIRAALDTAAALYAEASHAHGPVDVQRVRARFAIEREFASPAALRDCLEAYQRLDFPRGMLSVLMDLSQLAHESGDTATAALYRQHTISLSEEVGMGLARDGFQTAQIDLLMRNNDFGAAMELCQAALTGEPPAMIRAGYEQLLAVAYSFVSDLDAACAHGRQAIAMYEAMGAIDSASDAVIKIASDLSSFRREDTWSEAGELLETWSVKDEERGDYDAAANKRGMIAQVKIERFFYSPAHRGEPVLLEEAERELRTAEELVRRLPERDAARQLGKLYQLWGQIHQGREDEERVIAAWRDALATYERAGLAMDKANCHYILGAIYLNRANRDLAANFGEAESHLREALAYYDSAGVRGQAADTRFLFARLYTNASVWVAHELSQQLLDAVLGHLSSAEADCDAIRWEFNAGSSVVEVQRGKRALIKKSQRIYELALDILCRLRVDPAGAWGWGQRAKARALSDILAMGSAPPARVMAELESDPDLFALVTQDRELAARISKVSLEERVVLRQELYALWQRMGQAPRLAEYLELRMGAALDAADLGSMLSQEAEARPACVCIDWLAVGEHLFLLAMRPGQPPQLVPLPLQLRAVQAFVATHLAPESFRLTLRDVPELLQELGPLIAPLADLSAPEELLILCPTGPLHALPLHALAIDGGPLLARNPVVYCPSLSVLRHCLARQREGRDAPTAALFGDPNGDRAEAATLVSYLGQHFGTEPLIKGAVTRTAFIEGVSGRDFVHFQGHAVHKPDEPLASYLTFADGPFTARDVFGLADLRARLVTLAACESAASVIEAGDEPLGLIPAFLYAGADAVLATLWKVNQASAAQAMRLFYDMLAQGQEAIDKVQALRRAMLAVRDLPGFSSPYHWAPFTLHGDWR